MSALKHLLSSALCSSDAGLCTGTNKSLRLITTRKQSAALWLHAIQFISCPFRIERHIKSTGTGGGVIGRHSHELMKSGDMKCACGLTAGSLQDFACGQLVCDYSKRPFLHTPCEHTRIGPALDSVTRTELLEGGFSFCTEGTAIPLDSVLREPQDYHQAVACSMCNVQYCDSCAEDLFDCDTCHRVVGDCCGRRHDCGLFCNECDLPGYCS